jgi:CxC2 like cysteine cluster associated with KDZ transposases
MRLGRAEEMPDNSIYFFSYLHEHQESDNFQGQNDFLRQFISHEKAYLSHLLNLEMPPTNLTCSSCAYVEAGFHCLDCYGSHLWCQSCLILCHAQHPFHCPQQWKEGSFENVPLCDLGYVLVLGHSSSGGLCPEDDNLFGDCCMMVIHVNGVFKHCIRFCRCPSATSEHEQLFCYWLFPSTFDRPETVFTLDVLDYYGIDAMECKTSAQSFFQKLRRVTNNVFSDEVPVCSSIIDH